MSCRIIAFLKKNLNSLIQLFFDVWSYSLLSNHSHHIIKIKSIEVILKQIESEREDRRTISMNAFFIEPENEILLDAMLERQMNSFLVSYANYYNNKYTRKGGLFQKPFRRSQIADDVHLQQAIIYSNANAQKHHLTNDFTLYPHSSYQDILHIISLWVCCREVIYFFGSKEQFEKIHKDQAEYYYKNGGPSSKLE